MRTRRMVLWSLVLVACASRGSAVLVSVSASGALHGVTRLHAQAVAAGQRRDFDVTLKTATIPPAVTFGLDVPDSVQGSLLVHVTAFDARGTVLASGDGSTALAGGHRGSIAIVLPAPTPTGDGGADAGPPVVGVLGVLGQPCASVGELGCSGHLSKLPVVCGGGLTWQANGTCSGAQYCDSTPGATQGTCEPILALCAHQQPGDVVCNGLQRLRCGPDLVSTVDVESCPYVCTPGACIGVCAPGAVRCQENTPQSCDANGQWQGTAACAGQACVAGACQGVCTPGTMQCAGAVAQMCDGTGQWQGTAPCAGGFCNGAGVCGVCAAGSTQCAPGNVPQTCDASGQWQGATACSGQTCVAGACVGTCAPGAKQCSGNTPQTCGPDGKWQGATACAGQTCIGGACVGVCQAGVKGCVGDTPKSCGPDGQWQLGTACPGGYCNGAGVCGVCPAGAQRCSGLERQYCSSDGQWVSSSACEYVCTNGYCTGECTPGATNGCYNGAPATCSSDGYWQASGAACCAGCNGGTCNTVPCGYSVCTRVPSSDSFCNSTYPSYPYYWVCQDVNNCQAFGPSAPMSAFGGGGSPGGGRNNTMPAGAWCMSFSTSC